MRTLSYIRLATLLTLAHAIAACGPATDQANSGTQQDSIINGLLPDEPMHDSVVSLHSRSGDTWNTSIFCSGTLISSDVVLTAAHCLNVGRGRKVVTRDPATLMTYVGDNPKTDPSPEAYTVTQTLIHPGYDPKALSNDIALVRLSSAASVNPVDFLPASLGLTTTDEGAVINFCGFGQDENGDYDQKLQIDGTLDHLQSAFQIYYYQQDGGPCFGDSGGPAFIKRNNTPYVAGVTSYGDSRCAEYGVSTRPDYYTTWIDDFINQ